MQVAGLLDELGYSSSPSFLGRRQRALGTVPDYGHIFRLAKEKLSLCGVYTLRSQLEAPATPVVYVCQARTEQAADELHRYVWNQDVVPFLIVHTPGGVKLYSGFRHEREREGTLRGVLQPLTGFNDLAELIDEFCADSVDSGKLWRARGAQVTPEYRVDWNLLKNLRTLDSVLQKRGLPRKTSHALIGKYVYLHYLRDREILSPKKLNKWGVEPDSVFGRQATLKGVSEVNDRLNEWLNGSVFPLSFRGADAPKQEHLRYVAGVFQGDEVSEAGERQLSLDFQTYDFSFIPIETLSNVYEQFLHSPSSNDSVSHGREIGAYYTPIPVVNMMLAELEERRPLTRGMRILDPSCGSGAFLVQCFRRLIEKEFPPGTKPRPGELRSLLEEHIFGIDVQEDACNVTELSLALTLLDYIDPPDLEDQRHRFKLPALRGKNIYDSNFFSLEAAWHEPFSKLKFDWIVGNPPWKRLNPTVLSEDERPVWDWIVEHEKDCPIGGNQVARAFAWKVIDYLTDDGEVALFMPAMTLFEDSAEAFRSEFFCGLRVHTVSNFSNLAEVLSAGRFRVPSASFHYRHRPQNEIPGDDEFVRVYSPLVANQEATRPEKAGRRNETWSIIINASEIRDIPYRQVMGGSGLPWKLATWGSQLDSRLLNRLSRQFPSLGKLEDDGVIIIAEGPALVEASIADGPSRTRPEPEVRGKNSLDVKKLASLRHIFSFPSSSLTKNTKNYSNLRRGRRGIDVCRPPHIIVSAARIFAVYSDEFLIVPPRQIGITSPDGDGDLLKCLSLFLNSDFMFYHQFLTSTEFGVKRDRATLNALRAIPAPMLELSKSQKSQWLRLHQDLLKTSPITVKEPRRRESQQSLDGHVTVPITRLLQDLNDLVNDALRLDDGDRALVEDFVRVRLELNDGKVGDPAVRTPSSNELRDYAKRLKLELDDFVGEGLRKWHSIEIVYDGLSGLVCVDLTTNVDKATKVVVAPANAAESEQLSRTRNRLRKERAQWVYFDRNLRIYEGSKTYVLKPMQRFHWTQTQAMLDAREILAETLTPSEHKGDRAPQFPT